MIGITVVDSRNETVVLVILNELVEERIGVEVKAVDVCLRRAECFESVKEIKISGSKSESLHRKEQMTMKKVLTTHLASNTWL